MKAGKNLAMMCVAAILAAGCGQKESTSVTASVSASTNSSQTTSVNTSSSKPAAAAQPQPSLPQKSSGDSVDGYKSFKFGMKPSELLKLAECVSSDADYEKELKKYEEYLRKSEDELRLNENSIKEYNEKLVGLTGSADSSYHYGDTHDISAIKDKIHSNLGGKVFSLKRDIELWGNRVTDLKADKESYYLEHLNCKVNFAGEERKVDFLFDDQKQLKLLAFIVGQFNQQKFDSLLEELRRKYPLSSSPSDVAIATYNSERYGDISWFFADNSVELTTIKAQRFDGVPVIALRYHDAASAKEAFKESQKGEVSSGDL